MLIYSRKSFFKNIDCHRKFKFTTFLLEMMAVAIMLYNKKIGFILLNICIVAYFVGHMLCVKENVRQHKAKITAYYRKAISFYKYIAYMFYAFTVILIFLLCTTHTVNTIIIIWLALVTIMIYFDCTIVTAIVAFGEDGYVSGDYYIEYNNIEDISKEKSLYSWQGEIVLIYLWRGDEKIGFDKLFLDEYETLRTKVFQRLSYD
ncbi:MAG: hypothetical protein K5769_05695 [Pseudobutyrivibrio sp.]|nr:hypothetical protein [Pseudobutyrivibrio sp.]